MMSLDPSTPPLSRTSSSASKFAREGLTLDLSQLPPLITPAPPSNTLLITNLQDAEIFAQPTLAHIRELINKHTADDIYSFSPIRSFRRIIITFYNTESAVVIRSLMDGEVLFSSRLRIYFGEQTPTSPTDGVKKHLAAPRADKQFFISPPPSPPHGWEVREEEPPNKEVHAKDLVIALERLSARGNPSAALNASSTGPSGDRTAEAASGRKRSGSTIVFDPQESGNSPDLPAIAVEDTTDTPGDMTPVEQERPRLPMPKTERPPTDFMVGS